MCLTQTNELPNSLFSHVTDPSISRPTPLYGQPSWWGDDDENIKGQRRDPNGHEHHSGLKP